MNNTEKLLRAFIEASGYSIESELIVTFGESIKAGSWGVSAAAKGEYEFFPANDEMKEAEYREVIRTIDYKVTKKVDRSWYDDVATFGVSATIVNTDGSVTRISPEQLFKGAKDEKT